MLLHLILKDMVMPALFDHVSVKLQIHSVLIAVDVDGFGVCKSNFSLLIVDIFTGIASMLCFLT